MSPSVCPNCRTPIPADAPPGVCPACALRAGFASEGGGDADGGLVLEQLEERLPELEDFAFLGRGGMGSVFRARHRELGRAVAVKVLDPSLAHEPGFTERFTREARTLAGLSHPNIVTVYDFGHRDGLHYLIMELVEGVNLRDAIRAGGVTPAEALEMVPRICEALQFAHDRGVVHRDIKPENILVERSGGVKIADFGLAKLTSTPDVRLTRTEQIVGTYQYMAPEQMENSGAVDHRADIFALGVVFYELLTGELPVGRFAPPSKVVEVDVRLDEVVLRTLEKEPGLRYQQASEVKTDVESVVRGDFVSTSVPVPAKTGFEFRSKETLFGMPLVHVVFGGGASGSTMKVARGIIAIGDVAMGGVAVGGMAFGVIPFGGLSFGLSAVGGLAVGLVTALGGCAFGGVATGGLAMAVLAGRGGLSGSLFTLSEAGYERALFFGWLIATIAVSIGITAAGYASFRAAGARRAGGG